MKTSANIQEISKAFHKAQSEMSNAKLNKTNPYHKSKYGDLESVLEAIKKPLNRNGLFVTQETVYLEQGVSVLTRVIHTSGQFFEYGPLIIPTGKNDAHSTGSSITYAKRYMLSAIFAIVADEDDDGNAAQKSEEQKKEKEKASLSDVKAFYKKHATDDFLKEKLDEFLERYTNHYKTDINQAIMHFIKNEDEFLKFFKSFLNQPKEEKQ